jgi:GTPase SAR1 family protein
MEVDVSVWDTAAQEQFNKLTPLYALSAAAAIVAAYITNPNSFAKLHH